MRILIVSDVSSWMRGGVPAETFALVQGLHERGHTVALACDAPLRGAESALHLAIRLPIGAHSRGELRSALASFRPDFVHLICMNSLGLLTLAPVLRGQAWALTIHSLPPYENKLHGWHANDALHYALRNLRYLPNSLAWRYVCRRVAVPKVVVHSEVVRKIAVSYGVSRDRIELIPLFFRAAVQPPGARAVQADSTAPMLLTVGGITHTKGQRDVVVALAALGEEFPDLTYRMVGEVRDSSYLADLRRLAERLGVAERVVLSSNVDAKTLAELRGRADLYVQPSHEEGFCLAYAEAAACIPRLVGTETGAIAEMSRDDPGATVVPVRNPKALAVAIAAQLRRPPTEDALASRCRRLEERFAFDAYLAAHEALYRAAHRSGA